MKYMDRSKTEEELINAHDSFKSTDPDAWKKRKKEIEEATGAAIDETIIRAVLYGATSISLAIKVGVDEKKDSEAIFFVAGRLIADFLKVKNNIKK